MTFRPTWWIAIAACWITFQSACGSNASTAVSQGERRAIADSLRRIVVNTYDLAKPGAVERLMSLYPATGPVYSASGGQVSTTRDGLQRQLQTFWQYVGSNMREPKWEWTSIYTDVLGPEAAVMTATYRIPHLNPQGTHHVIGGAWTAAWAKRNGRWFVVHEHLSDARSTAVH